MRSFGGVRSSGSAIAVLVLLTGCGSAAQASGPGGPASTSGGAPPTASPPARVPTADDLAVGPRLVSAADETPLPLVEAGGWRRLGLPYDRSLPASISWPTLPVAARVRIEAPVPPEGVDVVGYTATDVSGLPEQAHRLVAHCGPAGEGQGLTCRRSTGAQGDVLVVQAPAEVRYLTVRASWRAVPAGAPSARPVEVFASWAGRPR